MVTKLFMFQFVNSYASFFYVAFISESLGECDRSTCMSSLATNLGIIFGSRLVIGNLTELLLPYLSYQYKLKKELSGATGVMSRPEREFLLDPVSFKRL